MFLYFLLSFSSLKMTWSLSFAMLSLLKRSAPVFGVNPRTDQLFLASRPLLRYRVLLGRATLLALDASFRAVFGAKFACSGVAGTATRWVVRSSIRGGRTTWELGQVLHHIDAVAGMKARPTWFDRV